MTALLRPRFPEIEPEAFAAPDIDFFDIRALNEFDGNAFRAMRLEATTGQDRRNFVKTDEVSWPLERWQERCTRTPYQIIFGAWHRGELVGAMAAWRYDKSPRTALWGNTYLHEKYRRQRRALLLYEPREDWTRNNPNYETAVFFIREDNKRSREIHEENGALMFAVEPKLWCDGKIAPACWYEKPLRSLAP